MDAKKVVKGISSGVHEILCAIMPTDKVIASTMSNLENVITNAVSIDTTVSYIDGLIKLFKYQIEMLENLRKEVIDASKEQTINEEE